MNVVGMSSDHQQPSRPSLEDIKLGIANQTLSETSYLRLELKSNWKTEHGKNISAIANHDSLAGGWIIVGVDDSGKLAAKDENWCKKKFELIGNQVNQFLSPTQAVKDIYSESFGDAYCIMIEIQNPGYITNEQVASNVEKRGLYSILIDSFIAHIQTASERKGATVEGNSTALKEYQPYPPKLLREILANAVAHALYQQRYGEVIVDIHLDRVTVRNNAPLEAEIFAKQWFSKQTMAKNKLLMEVLRTAGITDELGTGKANVFKLVIEAGKEEPVIDFSKFENFAKWQLTVYNSQRHEHIGNLLAKLTDLLPSPLHARMATAPCRRKQIQLVRFSSLYFLTFITSPALLMSSSLANRDLFQLVRSSPSLINCFSSCSIAARRLPR